MTYNESFSAQHHPYNPVCSKQHIATATVFATDLTTSVCNAKHKLHDLVNVCRAHISRAGDRDVTAVLRAAADRCLLLSQASFLLQTDKNGISFHYSSFQILVHECRNFTGTQSEQHENMFAYTSPLQYLLASLFLLQQLAIKSRQTNSFLTKQYY